MNSRRDATHASTTLPVMVGQTVLVPHDAKNPTWASTCTLVIVRAQQKRPSLSTPVGVVGGMVSFVRDAAALRARALVRQGGPGRRDMFPGQVSDHPSVRRSGRIGAEACPITDASTRASRSIPRAYRGRVVSIGWSSLSCAYQDAHDRLLRERPLLHPAPSGLRQPSSASFAPTPKRRVIGINVAARQRRDRNESIVLAVMGATLHPLATATTIPNRRCGRRVHPEGRTRGTSRIHDPLLRTRDAYRPARIPSKGRVGAGLMGSGPSIVMLIGDWDRTSHPRQRPDPYLGNPRAYQAQGSLQTNMRR